MKQLLTLLITIFSFNSFSQGTDYDYIGTGDITDVNSWVDQFDGVTPPVDFAAGNFHIKNTAAVTLDADWDVTEDVIVEGGVHFTIDGTKSITSTLFGVVNVMNTATVTITSTAALPIRFAATLSGEVNYQTTSSVPPCTFNILTINSVTKLGGSNTTASTLTINSGAELDLNGKKLTIVNSASCSGTGTFKGLAAASVTAAATTAQLIINGSSTIAFTSGFEVVRTFSVNCPGSSVTLNSNLGVNASTSSIFSIEAGTLNIAGKSLTINSKSKTKFSGSITSSNTTSLSIGGTGAFTGSLLLSPSIYDLTLNRGGETLTLGSPLDIINSITPTAGTIASGGNVKLKNSSGQHSRIGVVGATGAITGNIIVENFIPGTVAGWRTLGAPGISGLTVADWDGGSGSTTDFAMTCVGCIYDPTAIQPTPFCSIQSNPSGDDLTFVELSSGTPLTPGEGFWAYVGTSLTTAQNVTQTDIGAAVTGPVTSPSRFAANPYACPLSLASLQGSNPGMGGINCYDPVSMSYIAQNGGIPSNIIPMGQGFYANGVASITFNESNKDVSSVTSTRNIQKTMSPSQTSSLVIGAVFQLGITGFLGDYDNTYIRLHPNGTPGYDLPLDCYKMYGTPGYAGTGPTYSQYTNIATVAGNQDYAINSLSDIFTTDLVIPVIARAQVTGQYTISPIDIQNLPGNACVSLFDKLLNVSHDLRTGSYICNINDTTQAARFELTICLDQTVTSVNTNNINNNNVLIGQDGTAGVFVKTKFEKNMKSVISAYNLMGQKIINDKEIEGLENVTYLDFKDVHNQIVIVKVTNANGQTTKKVYIN
ncbi:MAG: hypothetical protein K9H41_03455 [Bacteroidia bacterium]|nr:hypothetical protein [Bacteroidia bacterium]